MVDGQAVHGCQALCCQPAWESLSVFYKVIRLFYLMTCGTETHGQDLCEELKEYHQALWPVFSTVWSLLSEDIMHLNLKSYFLSLETILVCFMFLWCCSRCTQYNIHGTDLLSPPQTVEHRRDAKKGRVCSKLQVIYQQVHHLRTLD